ncbi:MAG: PHP domain-containing protein [Treponema sp.]|nr:PHP domain-containing protein [Treponema sp.]
MYATLWGMIDLHTHSTASDGDLSPQDLVRAAKKRGIGVLALTDHDTLGGLEAAAQEARTQDIGFVPGIEISISWAGGEGISGLGPGGEMHLLGLGLHSPSPGFLAAISELSKRREARNRNILDRMHELSIDATWEEVLEVSGGHSIGRPHFATLLIRRKIVRNQEQAFARYLGIGKPLYVPKVGLAFDQATALIRESGGIPVLAHPMSLFVAWGRLPDLIKALKDRGLMGLEAWHPTTKPKSCRRLEALALDLGLHVTEGSDFHGNAWPDRKLGCSNKGREISSDLLKGLPGLFVGA